MTVASWTDDRLSELAHTTLWSFEQWRAARDYVTTSGLPADQRDAVRLAAETIALRGLAAPDTYAANLILIAHQRRLRNA